MGRYNQTKEKKPVRTTVVIFMVLMILVGGGWFCYDWVIQEWAKLGPGNISHPLADEISFDASVPESTTREEVTTEPEAADDSVQMQKEEQPLDLPALIDSDGPFREAMIKLSPGLAPWLSTDQLIRKYVLIANDFSQGFVIENHMRFLKPTQPFAVDQTDKGTYISKKSYQRYDALAAVINAIDEQLIIEAYKKFRPLLLQVYSDFSYPEESNLEDILIKAAGEIMAAPIIEEPIALVRQSVKYKFADAKLEGSSPVSKQMLRMGPENTRIIQNKIQLLAEQLIVSFE
jgi:hypothetical protein